jgi:hypothetical protein
MVKFSVVLVVPELLPPAMERFCEYLNTTAEITDEEKLEILREFRGVNKRSGFWTSSAWRKYVLYCTLSHLFIY